MRGFVVGWIILLGQSPARVQAAFHRLAEVLTWYAGSVWVFCAAVALVVIWSSLGPMFGFSERWQLWINTVTTIITFLMVFVIHHTQTIDTVEVKAMLRELIHVHDQADNAVAEPSKGEG